MLKVVVTMFVTTTIFLCSHFRRQQQTPEAA